MQEINKDKQLINPLKQRRQKLAQLIDSPVILWSGKAPSRNFPSNHYPFRANSHFLYFAGLPLENSVIHLEQGKLTLFQDNVPPENTLWYGEPPTRELIAETLGADYAYPLSELKNYTTNAATIAVQDVPTYQQQCQHLNRHVPYPNELEGKDLALAKAIISLRLIHDQEALTEIKKAIAIAIEAHKTGMKVTPKATTEAQVRGAMEGVIIGENMKCAYGSIVTVHGEILHNDKYSHSLNPGELLLADVGAETPLGWASDITRTWPVNGQFSPSQRDIYDVVLAAHDACIEKMHSGVEYRDIHLIAALIMAEGLVNLGILRGNPNDLVDKDAHALFFPHGIGHLLGLDVHDMEDLGDLAGYEISRTRSDRFGLGYLRLDRPLRSGMVVTIEPGFYQVPGILNRKDFREKYKNDVNWDKLQQFPDVRGIRIEDDVLVTETRTEVLTANLPTQGSEIEALCSN